MPLTPGMIQTINNKLDYPLKHDHHFCFYFWMEK